MNERALPIDDATMRFGLLMESAQAHQKMAENHLARLQAHTDDLDEVVRDEIRRTLVEELKELTVEGTRAAQALRSMQRTANMRGLFVAAALATLATAIPGAFMHWMLPSAEELDRLRVKRDRLLIDVRKLEQRGGRAELRRCGETARLCVRVDKTSPAYGEKGDFMVVKGY